MRPTTCAGAARSSVPMPSSTNPTRSTRWSTTAWRWAGRQAAEAGASVDQLVLQRVVREVAVGGEVHLLHQARAVRAHRLHRQRQRLRDVSGGFALRELQEHLELAL